MVPQLVPPVCLFLDDVRDPPNDGRVWTICRTAEEARDVLLAGPVDEATLDHDLGHCPKCDVTEERDEGLVLIDSHPCAHLRTGYDLVKWMAEHVVWPRLKPRVHSANPAGAANMRATIERYWGGVT